MVNSLWRSVGRGVVTLGLIAGLLAVVSPTVGLAAAAADEAAESGHAGGGHHDENDLSHANASPSLTSLTELKGDLAIYTFVVFLLLFGILLKFAWRPIMQGLDQRERTVAALLEEAKSNAAKSHAALQAHEAKLAAANEESRAIVAEARRAAEQLRESIVAEAHAVATRERERAVEDIASAKRAALSEIAQVSVNTAIGLAGRILRREIAGQDQDRLAREALDQFPSNN